MALFAQPAEPLPTPTGIFTRDHPHLAGQGFAVSEPCRIAQEHVRRQRRDRPHSWVGHQEQGSGTLPGLLLDSLVQFLDLGLELHVQRLQLGPSMRGMWRQRQRRDRVLACLAPQGGAPSSTVRQGNGLQRILDSRPHAYPLMTVQ